MGAPRKSQLLAIVCTVLLAGAADLACAQQADGPPQIAPPIFADSVADPEADGPEAGDDVQPRRRLPPQDGDLPPSEETQFGVSAPEDGTLDVGEPAPVEDGATDETQVDVRQPEDASAFSDGSSAERPAGYDSLLFQIEDLDPIRDNRTPVRLFRLEPYDPIGVRIGNFVLFPEVEIGGTYYSNVFRAPGAQSDFAADIRPYARLVSDWRRHALEFRALGGFSAYDEFDSEDERSYLLEARGKLDVSYRTNVQGLVSYNRVPESRSALNATSVGSRVEQVTERAEAALNHRFNRLSMQLRGGITDYAFGDSELGGVTTFNEDRDYTQYEETGRLQWEFKPTLSAFAEVNVNQRGYDRPATSDGINRSSDGQRYRAGLAFGNTGEILRGEIGLGWGVQTPDDSRLHEIDGLIIDANAAWRVSELTSVIFEARSDISDTTTADVGGALYRFAGVEVRHALRRYLVGMAGLSYATQDSGDGIIDESELIANVGAEYYISPETVLVGRYAHSKFDAVGATSDFSADEVHLGVRFRR